MKPSTAAVLALLRQRGEQGLTQIEALEAVGTFRLGARVFEAREYLEPGEVIVNEWASFGNKRVARYVLRRRTETAQLALSL
jgi:hypothetical protein